jgi:hypothetical protein
MAIDDDGGRQVMAIPYLTLTLWVRWANKVLTDITLISTSWGKRFSYNRSKQSRWLSWRYYLIDITEFCLKYSSILSSSHKDGGWAGPHKCVHKLLHLIFFSETTGSIGTKLGMNVQWMVPYKIYVFFVDQKYTKDTRGPKGVKKGVSIYMDINYLLFICFYEDFFKENPFRNIHNVIM